jgi:hypothetical protein
VAVPTVAGPLVVAAVVEKEESEAATQALQQALVLRVVVDRQVPLIMEMAMEAMALGTTRVALSQARLPSPMAAATPC